MDFATVCEQMKTVFTFQTLLTHFISFVRIFFFQNTIDTLVIFVIV